MTISTEKNCKQNKHIVSTAEMPNLFRLVHLNKKITYDGCNMFNAELFNESVSISVTWIRDCDDKLVVGQLVYPDWMSQQISIEGSNIIKKLTALKTPIPRMNIFETVPWNWIKNRALIHEARNIFDSLSQEYALLANSVFWEHTRFYRFLVVPHNAKIQSHVCGNFRETIRLTLAVRSLIMPNSKVDKNIATLAAWLRYAENSDKFTYNSKINCFELRIDNDLESKANTIIQWMNIAAHSYPFNMPETDYLKLTSTLIISRMPLTSRRRPWIVSYESNVIAIATKLLNHIDLEKQAITAAI